MYVPLDRDARETLAKQISTYLEELIRRGHLRGGARLPATRALARDLGVNKGTVESAYDELSARRLVRIHAGKGVVVRTRIPEPTTLNLPWKQPKSRDPIPPAGWVSQTPTEDSIRDFAGTLPGIPLFGAATMRQLHEIAIQGGGSPASAAPPLGDTSLRAAACRHLARGGVIREPDDVAVFANRSVAVERITRQFVPQQGRVLLIGPTDPEAIAGLRAAKVRLTRTEDDAAERSLRRADPRLIFVTTGASRLPGRPPDSRLRRLLLDVARERGVPVVEDVTHAEWLVPAPMPPALAVLDGTGRVIPLCDVSGEIGGPYGGAVAAGSSKLLERLRQFPGDERLYRLPQRVLAAALDASGRVRAQRVLQEKRGLLRGAVARFLNRHLAAAPGHEFSTGLDAVRVDLPDDLAGSALRDEAQRHGVRVWSATDCGFARAWDRFVLLDLTRHEEGELLDGIRRLGAAFDRLESRRGTS